jgi:hypothetical protein
MKVRRRIGTSRSGNGNKPVGFGNQEGAPGAADAAAVQENRFTWQTMTGRPAEIANIRQVKADAGGARTSIDEGKTEWQTRTI